MAERGGFEPPKRGLDAYTLSRRAPSTTRTPLRGESGQRIVAVSIPSIDSILLGIRAQAIGSVNVGHRAAVADAFH